MDSQVKLTHNGQQIQQGDVNLLGETAALAGDVALQDLLGMIPTSASGAAARCIVPLWTGASTLIGDHPPLVSSAGGTGSVAVYPFLAVVGSRGGEATNLEGWKDIRTQVMTGEAVTGTLFRLQALASNASGNPRWDLVYVTMAVDTDDAAVTRYVKAPSTTVASAVSVAVTQSTKLTLNVAQGTPGASPAKPALPSDSGSNYNIAIAYVRVPNGFGGTTAVSIDDIQECNSVRTMSTRSGVATCAPASMCNDPALPMLATRHPWPATGTARPHAYLPPSMQGKVERILPFHFASAPVSVATGDIIDDTIDWRHRFFKWTLQLRTSRTIASSNSATGAFVVPNAGNSTNTFTGMGQSFTLDNTTFYARGSTAASVGGTSMTGSSNATTADGFDATAFFALYVDQDTGELKVHVTGVLGLQTIVVWLEASGQFYNAIFV